MNALCKRKTTADGKGILVNFILLNPDKFRPLHDLTKKSIKKETLLCSPDGKLYINSANPFSEFTFEMLELLTVQTKETLDLYLEEYGKKYPDVTYGNIENYMNSDKEFREAFALLLIPAELKRREIERSYYGK